VSELVDIYKSAADSGADAQTIENYDGDTTAIDAESVWTVKGPRAPGSTDMRRREQVLDAIGVARQLVFPTAVGLHGAMLRTGSAERLYTAPPGMDVKEYSQRLFHAHNEWVVRAGSASPRLRIVAVLQAASIDELMRETSSLIDRGVRAIQVLSAEPLAGRSPAHDELDPFYELLARNDVALLLHVGGDGGFLATEEWGDAPFFDGYRQGLELSLSPYWTATFHLAAQNYLATMVTGGVFARHPDLRFGAIELTGHWIGPLARMLDMWWSNGILTVRGQQDARLPERPSDYIRRNVRVSVFDFEPVDEYFQMYDLDDVYCFATDFPHVEGGKDPMDRLIAKLEPLGHEVIEKFFVRNGELLLPG
jgi:predicted TIM-barrel fold metal-dependent hydrolase